MTKKKKIIGIIGHVGHGKTTLSAAVAATLSTTRLPEPKTIQEVIEESMSIPFTAPPKMVTTLRSYPIKSGKQERRERRQQERRKR